MHNDVAPPTKGQTPSSESKHCDRPSPTPSGDSVPPSLDIGRDPHAATRAASNMPQKIMAIARNESPVAKIGRSCRNRTYLTVMHPFIHRPQVAAAVGWHRCQSSRLGKLGPISGSPTRALPNTGCLHYAEALRGRKASRLLRARSLCEESKRDKINKCQKTRSPSHAPKARPQPPSGERDRPQSVPRACHPQTNVCLKP